MDLSGNPLIPVSAAPVLLQCVILLHVDVSSVSEEIESREEVTTVMVGGATEQQM